MALLVLLLLACRPPDAPAGATGIDAAIVPGCPSEADGRLSACQWRRALWAAHLYHAGVADRIVTSGAAVYNRYVEADALAAGLLALGVPDRAILRERQALHTDQNIAFALRMIDGHPDWILAVASDPLQAPGCCEMVEAWSGRACAALSMDMQYVAARYAAGLPDVRTAPTTLWLPLPERERRIAVLTGRRRANSMLIYAAKALLRPFGGSRPPVLPPPIETLTSAADAVATGG